MAQYEVIARARLDRRLSKSDAIDLALDSPALDRGMRLVRYAELPDGEVSFVLQRKLKPRKSDEAALMASRSLAQLGVPAAQVRQMDLIRLSRKGRTLVRSWTGPGGGPDLSGDREPRTPHPAPPSLRAARDLPHD